jgi:Uma2 family endonuclease
MGMPAPLYYTADMVRDLIDESRAWPRYELVYGELLVSPAPRAWHQEIVKRLVIALDAYLKREPVGHVFMAPADISWGRPDTIVQPDVFVFPPDEIRTWDWTKMMTMLLCAEVLSPSSLHSDRFTKRRLYQDEQVPLYWIVDADARRVEVWRPDLAFPEFETERITWHPEGASVPFVMTLEELFRDA